MLTIRAAVNQPLSAETELETTTATATTATTAGPPPKLEKLELFIILGIALGSVLVSLSFLLFYCCCKRLFCPSSGTEVYQNSGQTLAKLYKSPSQSVYLVAPDTVASNQSGVFDVPDRTVTASEPGDASTIAKMPMSLAGPSHPTTMSPAERVQKRASPRLNRVSTVSKAISSPPLYLDKRSITADMLNPGKTNSRREIVLFKAPSFNE